jgi:hypothetical protein
MTARPRPEGFMAMGLFIYEFSQLKRLVGQCLGRRFIVVQKTLDHFRRHVKAAQNMWSECIEHRDVARIAAPRDYDTPDAGHVVARIERMPSAVLAIMV